MVVTLGKLKTREQGSDARTRKTSALPTLIGWLGLLVCFGIAQKGKRYIFFFLTEVGDLRLDGWHADAGCITVYP